MKIQMTRTVQPVGFGKSHAFFKGRKYWAIEAHNQPDWQAKGKVFAVKANNCDILLERGDYKKV